MRSEPRRDGSERRLSPGLSRQGTATRQIVDDMRRRIVGGEFGEDGRLPSEADLCKHYGVSRIPVRAAYQELIEGGLVDARERQGYFVHLIKPILLRLDGPSPDAADSEVPSVSSWDIAVLADGRQPRTEVKVRVLGGADDPAPAEILERLRLGADDLVVLRDRVCFVDDVPFMLRPSYYPEQAARGTILMRAGEHPAAGGLLAAIGRPAAGVPDDYIRARMPSPEEVDRLRLPRVTPCLDWLRTRFSKDGTPLVVSQSVMPGDRIALAGHFS